MYSCPRCVACIKTHTHPHPHTPTEKEIDFFRTQLDQKAYYNWFVNVVEPTLPPTLLSTCISTQTPLHWQTRIHFLSVFHTKCMRIRKALLLLILCCVAVLGRISMVLDKVGYANLCELMMFYCCTAGTNQ